MAISPLPILAVKLPLFTPPARSYSPAFAAGYVLALLLVGSLCRFRTPATWRRIRPRLIWRSD